MPRKFYLKDKILFNIFILEKNLFIYLFMSKNFLIKVYFKYFFINEKYERWLIDENIEAWEALYFFFWLYETVIEAETTAERNCLREFNKYVILGHHPYPTIPFWKLAMFHKFNGDEYFERRYARILKKRRKTHNIPIYWSKK
jgi:hypothetical protein